MITAPAWQPPGGTLLCLAAFALLLALTVRLLRRCIRAESRLAATAA